MTRCDNNRKHRAHMIYRLPKSGAEVPLCEACAELFPGRLPIYAID